ncbi:unnamed protein product, partial [Porites lobata]
MKEWSFKKAITIQTYRAYHPIPVPLNLISNSFLWIKRLYLLCSRRCCDGRQDNNSFSSRNFLKKKGKALNEVVEKLQNEYLSSYGYSFPLTDERKMDFVLQELERNRQMVNQIAYKTFAASGINGSIFPTGPK